MPATRPTYPPNDWRSTLMPPEPTQSEPANGGPVQYQPWGANQQPAGSVYSGPADRAPRTGPLGRGTEQSGSLTGHILAQGQHDAPPAKSRTLKVVLILLVVLGLLVGAGVAVVAFGGDSVRQVFDDLVKG